MIERDETRERFLGAIAERVQPESIAEAHLFPPIKQGGIESGVAVVAVSRTGSAAAADNSPADVSVADTSAAENIVREDELSLTSEPVIRLTVYTAKYRLTLKGPDRGKWEFAMHAEADAPLVTVDQVVRGVQRRSGDAEDPTKFSGDEFRGLLTLPTAERRA